MKSIHIALSTLGQNAQSALQFNITSDKPGINLKPSQHHGKHTKYSLLVLDAQRLIIGTISCTV